MEPREEPGTLLLAKGAPDRQKHDCQRKRVLNVFRHHLFSIPGIELW